MSLLTQCELNQAYQEGSNNLLDLTFTYINDKYYSRGGNISSMMYVYLKLYALYTYNIGYNVGPMNFLTEKQVLNLIADIQFSNL